MTNEKETDVEAASHNGKKSSLVLVRLFAFIHRLPKDFEKDRRCVPRGGW